MSCPTTETLLRMHDGEIASRERRALDEHVRGCAGCRAALAGLDAQRLLLREALAASLDEVDFAGLSQRVMRGVQAERPVALRDRIAVWLEEFFRHRRRVWVPALGAAMVAAVVVGVFGLSGPGPAPEPGGSAVVAIDAADSPPIVFDIPSEDGLSSTAVVWVNDEEGSGS